MAEVQPAVGQQPEYTKQAWVNALKQLAMGTDQAHRRYRKLRDQGLAVEERKKELEPLTALLHDEGVAARIYDELTDNAKALEAFREQQYREQQADDDRQNRVNMILTASGQAGGMPNPASHAPAAAAGPASGGQSLGKRAKNFAILFMAGRLKQLKSPKPGAMTGPLSGAAGRLGADRQQQPDQQQLLQRQGSTSLAAAAGGSDATAALPSAHPAALVEMGSGPLTRSRVLRAQTSVAASRRRRASELERVEEGAPSAMQAGGQKQGNGGATAAAAGGASAKALVEKEAKPQAARTSMESFSFGARPGDEAQLSLAEAQGEPSVDSPFQSWLQDAAAAAADGEAAVEAAAAALSGSALGKGSAALPPAGPLTRTNNQRRSSTHWEELEEQHTGAEPFQAGMVVAFQQLERKAQFGGNAAAADAAAAAVAEARPPPAPLRRGLSAASSRRASQNGDATAAAAAPTGAAGPERAVTSTPSSAEVPAAGAPRQAPAAAVAASTGFPGGRPDPQWLLGVRQQAAVAQQARECIQAGRDPSEVLAGAGPGVMPLGAPDAVEGQEHVAPDMEGRTAAAVAAKAEEFKQAMVAAAAKRAEAPEQEAPPGPPAGLPAPSDIAAVPSMVVQPVAAGAAAAQMGAETPRAMSPPSSPQTAPPKPSASPLLASRPMPPASVPTSPLSGSRPPSRRVSAAGGPALQRLSSGVGMGQAALDILGRPAKAAPALAAPGPGMRPLSAAAAAAGRPPMARPSTAGSMGALGAAGSPYSSAGAGAAAGPLTLTEIYKRAGANLAPLSTALRRSQHRSPAVTPTKPQVMGQAPAAAHAPSPALQGSSPWSTPPQPGPLTMAAARARQQQVQAQQAAPPNGPTAPPAAAGALTSNQSSQLATPWAHLGLPSGPGMPLGTRQSGAVPHGTSQQQQNKYYESWLGGEAGATRGMKPSQQVAAAAHAVHRAQRSTQREQQLRGQGAPGAPQLQRGQQPGQPLAGRATAQAQQGSAPHSAGGIGAGPSRDADGYGRGSPMVSPTQSASEVYASAEESLSSSVSSSERSFSGGRRALLTAPPHLMRSRSSGGAVTPPSPHAAASTGGEEAQAQVQTAHGGAAKGRGAAAGAANSAGAGEGEDEQMEEAVERLPTLLSWGSAKPLSSAGGSSFRSVPSQRADSMGRGAGAAAAAAAAAVAAVTAAGAPAGAAGARPKGRGKPNGR